MIAIYDKRLPNEYLEALQYRFPEVEWLPLEIDTKTSVYQSIQFHPDIYIFQINSGESICAPSVSEVIINRLKDCGIKVIGGTNSPQGKYPGTAGYNAVLIGNNFIHNSKNIDPVIIDKVHELGASSLHVEQGYSRCSVVPIGKKAIITQDRGITKIVREKGIDVLEIQPGHVILPGEEYGFLGGASGIMPNGTVVFVGDIDLHSDADEIKLFLNKHDIQYIVLHNMPLYDCGTIMFFKD